MRCLAVCSPQGETWLEYVAYAPECHDTRLLSDLGGALSLSLPRVAQIAAPGDHGGLERVLQGLVSALAAGPASIVPILVLEPDVPEPSWVQGWREAAIVPEIVRVSVRDYLEERRLVRAILERTSANVVHTHGYRADALHGGALGHGLRSVSTVHGFTGQGRKGRFYEWVQRRALGRFDAVIAVSDPLRRDLIASGLRPSQVHLIPNVLAGRRRSRHTRPEARRLLGIPEEGLVVGWVGRLSQEKGPDVLLESAMALNDPTVTFAVIGDGPLRDTLGRRIAELGLSSRVRLLGARADAAAYMLAFDVLALSSRTEGTPMVLLEAAEAEVPFVATAVGGVPSLVGHEVEVLVPSERPVDLARAIRAALELAPAFVGAAMRVQREIVRQHSASDWVDAHLDVYRRVLGAR